MSLKKTPKPSEDKTASCCHKSEAAQLLCEHEASRNQYGKGKYQHNARMAYSSEPTPRSDVQPIIRRCGNEGPMRGAGHIKPGGFKK